MIKISLGTITSPKGVIYQLKYESSKQEVFLDKDGKSEKIGTAKNSTEAKKLALEFLKKKESSTPVVKTETPILSDKSYQGVYSEYAGQQIIKDAEKDIYGNAQGNQYDLAKDNAFKGSRIFVLHLYYGEGFDFKYPKKALKEKGFSVTHFQGLPPLDLFKEELNISSQLWILSSHFLSLKSSYIKEIENFYHSGKGLYIWGDNEPYYADANKILNKLFQTTLNGNYFGDKILTIKKKKDQGFIPHYITTGLENLYEGITISHLTNINSLNPLMYDSSGNVVIATNEKDRKRVIIDGGFTRLFVKWDSAGTGRYVKNAAAWLANYERFGDLIFNGGKSDKYHRFSK
jgi:hypothetical protein